MGVNRNFYVFWVFENLRDSPPYLAVQGNQGNAKLISHYTWQFITANPRVPEFSKTIKESSHDIMTREFPRREDAGVRLPAYSQIIEMISPIMKGAKHDKNNG